MTNSTAKFIPISHDTARAHPLYGVKGWLIVFGIVTVLGFLFNWGKFQFKYIEIGFKGTLFDLLWLEGMGAHRFLFFIDLALLLFVLFLMFTKHRKFRLIVIAIAVLGNPLSLLIALSGLLGKPDGSEVVKQLLFWVISMAIWVSYFNRSKRVRVTYENMVLNDGSYTTKEADKSTPMVNTTPFIHPVTASTPSKVAAQNTPDQQATQKTTRTMSTPASSSAEDIWALALAEFESDKRRAGIWAQAYAEADGNEGVAKARYIKTRAAELTAEKEFQAAQLQAELEKQALLAELAQLSATEKEKQLAALAREQDPKGECPNCKKIIYLDLSSCPKCKAIFRTESSERTNWAIKPLSASEVTARGSIM
jgi:Protein of unknown function (DUF2569)